MESVELFPDTVQALAQYRGLLLELFPDQTFVADWDLRTLIHRAVAGGHNALLVLQVQQRQLAERREQRRQFADASA